MAKRTGVSGNREERRTGLNWRQLRELRGQVAFLQNFKCWGCDQTLIPNNGHSHLHHKNGKPKDNRIVNLAVCCQLDHWFAHGFKDSIERGLQPKLKRTRKKDKNKNQTKLEDFQ